MVKIDTVRLDYLVTLKNRLADNLITKGVNASKDELYDTLVEKVLDIQTGSGSSDENISSFLSGTATDLTLDNNITDVRNYLAYQDTTLESVFIPTYYDMIGNYAFYNCTSLNTVKFSLFTSEYAKKIYIAPTDLTIRSGTINLTTDSNIVYKYGVQLTNGYDYDFNVTVTEDGDYELVCYTTTSNRKFELYINGELYNTYTYTVNQIITIPLISGVNTITIKQSGTSTVPIISHFSLASSNGSETILNQYQHFGVGRNAFQGCTSLTDFLIPSNCKIICTNAFNGCIKISLFNALDNIEVIGSGAFYNCNGFNELVIPSTLKLWGTSTFRGSDIKKVTLEENINIKQIPTDTFYGCTKLTEVSLNNTIDNIGGSAFLNCPIKNILLSDVQYILGTNCFRNTNVETVTLNSPTLANGVYYGCTKLTEVTLKDVTTIPAQLFYGCTSLKRVIIDATILPTLSNVNAFTNTLIANVNETDACIYVRSEIYDEIITATNWTTYADKIKIIENDL